MINSVVLVGRITKEPDVQKTQSGVSFVRFTIACNRTFKDQNGEKQADFINCIAWRHSAEFIRNYVRKGNLIAIEGRIQTGSFVDSDNQTRFTTDVLVEQVSNLEPRDPQRQGNYNQNNYSQNNYSNNVRPNDFSNMQPQNNFNPRPSDFSNTQNHQYSSPQSYSNNEQNNHQYSSPQDFLNKEQNNHNHDDNTFSAPRVSSLEPSDDDLPF